MPNLPKETFKPTYAPASVNTRATGDQSFYNSPVWRNTSKAYRDENPLCENCFDKGRLTDAALVDHIIPLPVGDQFSRRNLMSLCHACHNQKSGKEGHAGGPLIAHNAGFPVNRLEIFKILR